MESEGSETPPTPLLPKWAVVTLIGSTSLFVLFILGIFWFSRQTNKITQPKQTVSLSNYDYVFSKGGKIYGGNWSGREGKEQEIVLNGSPISYSPGANRQLLLSPFKHHLLYSDLKTGEIIIVDLENQQLKREKTDNNAQYFLSPTNRILFRQGNKLVQLGLSLGGREELALSDKERLLTGISPSGDFAVLSSSKSGTFVLANLAKGELTSFSIASPSGQLPTPLNDGTILYPRENKLNLINPNATTSSPLAGTFPGKIARLAESPTGKILAVLWYTTQPNLSYSLSLYDRESQKISDIGIIQELTERRDSLRLPHRLFFLDENHIYLSYRRSSDKSRPKLTQTQYSDLIIPFGEGIYDLQTKQFILLPR